MRKHTSSDGAARPATRKDTASRQASLGFGPATEIPDRLFFRIGEVARLCDVAPYVLRFWESEFPMLRPGKAGTGQRLFRRRDAEMALRIRHLLYEEGYTIQGARQLLKAEARPHTDSPDPPPPATPSSAPDFDARQARMRSLREDLRALHALLAPIKPLP